MKQYEFTSPPKHPGIYALKKIDTGQLYIGKSVNLQRRFSEWKSVFATGMGSKNCRIVGKLGEWVFIVVIELPGASAGALDHHEAAAIQRIMDSAPERLLNITPVPGPKNRHAGSRPLTEITFGGNTITYEKAAAALGVRVQSLRKRLMKHRKKGRHKISLEELTALSEKYNPQNTI